MTHITIILLAAGGVLCMALLYLGAGVMAKALNEFYGGR